MNQKGCNGREDYFSENDTNKNMSMSLSDDKHTKQ